VSYKRLATSIVWTVLISSIAAGALAQPLNSVLVQLGHLQFAVAGLNETVQVEIPARLLFADEPARLAVLRLTLDGVTTNELTLLQLTQPQAGSADPVDGGSRPLPLSLPVAREDALVVPGRYLLEVAAITGDGSAEALLSREDIFGSAELSELQYRLRFANRVLQAQVEAAKAVLAAVENAEPALFEPDSSGIKPLNRGVLEIHRRQLDSASTGLSGWLSGDGAVLSPVGPVIEAGPARGLVTGREQMAYDAQHRSPGGAVMQALLNYVGASLDSVNTRLLQARMEMEEYTAKPAPTELERRHLDKLKGRIAELEEEQEKLLALYLRLEAERLMLPAFGGWKLDEAQAVP